MFRAQKLFSYLISITIAIIAIYLLQPYLNDYKQEQQYQFEVNHIDGKLTNEDFKGNVLAIYFGYTFCPDVCPTSLSSLAMALNEFDDKRTQNFKGLFISVDPDRDKLQPLNEYAAYFHKSFVGATTDKKSIDDMTKRFGTFYEKVKLEGSQMDYSVTHTSFIYIFDKEGRLVQKIDHFSDVEFIKSVLNKVL